MACAIRQREEISEIIEEENMNVVAIWENIENGNFIWNKEFVSKRQMVRVF